MRILVVDDSAPKRAHVLKVLREEFAVSEALSLHEAGDYDQALERLRSHFYDLVILDLLLPGAGHEPSKETSKALIGTLLRGENLIPPTHIIGLTEYPEWADAERAFYDEHLLALVVYDAVDLAWSERLCSRIRYLSVSKRAATHYGMNRYDLDVVVLTARHAREYLPVRRKLFRRASAEAPPQWEMPITFGEIAGPDGRTLRGAVICVGEMGMAATATAATEAINRLRPRLLAMVGMCCGFNTKLCGSPQRLGDAIVVRESSCWEEGKYIDPDEAEEPEFRNRAITRLASERVLGEVAGIVEAAEETLSRRVTRFAATQVFQNLRTTFGPDDVRECPEVRFGAMVSGSSVVADEKMIAEILDRHPSAIGLDMEIYGLYTAVARATGAKPASLAVKGVADFGRSDKGPEAQVAASIFATEVFKGIVENLSIFQGDSAG